MTFTPKPGTGQLFKNDKKDSDRHPDIKGTITLEDGTTLNIAGWKKTSERTGKGFYSLKIDKPRDADSFRGGGAGPVAGGGSPRQEPGYDFDDAIPFITRDAVW